MEITSLSYLVFICIGIVVFYVWPIRSRWIWLLLLSFFFVFSSSPFGIVFILLSSIIVFLTAKAIPSAKRKRPLLVATITACLAILIILKYLVKLNFFAAHTLSLFGTTQTIRSIVETYLFPIGISYYTLQLISYLLDVYWGRQKAESNYLKVLLFTCYFPQMVQGPISKYSELAPELFRSHTFSWRNIKNGSQLILWGLFKKMLVADRIGVQVSWIFRADHTPYGAEAWLGLVFFGIQLYCDFSGGIDLIRGVSACLDIQMKENFRQPFFALSLSDFWRRWHISLGQWMKEYIFYPVSMSKGMQQWKRHLKKHISRKAATRCSMAVAYFIVFLLVGVWHGTQFNYFAWGLYNGIILSVSALLTDTYNRWKTKLGIQPNSKGWNGFCIFRTYIIVTIGWIFDCSTTIKEAGALFAHLFVPDFTEFGAALINGNTLIACGFGLFVLVVDILHEKHISVRQLLSKQNYGLQVAFWLIVIQCIACFGQVANAGGFMYANF